MAKRNIRLLLKNTLPLCIVGGLLFSMANKEIRLLFLHAGSTLSSIVVDAFSDTLPFTLHDRGGHIDRALAFYTNSGRAWMQRGLLRSTSYLPMIKKIFVRHGVPAELACIAFVESGFDNKATSAVWAHGMWQFMPETARAFGLRVDWTVDERQDFWRASEAAAKYLAGLYLQFGDWLLAAAAYNAGQNYLKGRLDATGSTSFWELLEKDALYEETSHYVPRLLAAMLIFHNPERYGFSLAGAAKPWLVCRGRLAANTLAEAASLYEVPVSRLIELNPQLERGIIPADDGGYEMTLPHPGEFFEQNDRAGMS